MSQTVFKNFLAGWLLSRSGGQILRVDKLGTRNVELKSLDFILRSWFRRGVTSPWWVCHESNLQFRFLPAIRSALGKLRLPAAFTAAPLLSGVVLPSVERPAGCFFSWVRDSPNSERAACCLRPVRGCPCWATGTGCLRSGVTARNAVITTRRGGNQPAGRRKAVEKMPATAIAHEGPVIRCAFSMVRLC